jgi:hypothetical protein
MTDANVHRLQADYPGAPVYWYYACPDCGLTLKLRSSPERAREDGVRHEAAKAQAKAAS